MHWTRPLVVIAVLASCTDSAGSQQGTRQSRVPSPAAREALTCTVERVTDGDTIRCRGGRRVRFLLVDTPEMDQGEFGRAARAVVMRHAPVGTVLALELDVQAQDRYGRTLAYVRTPDGVMLNEVVLREGVAVVSVYPPNVRHVDRFRAIADSARVARRGLWAGSAFECLPRDHRARRCSPATSPASPRTSRPRA